MPYFRGAAAAVLAVVLVPVCVAAQDTGQAPPPVQQQIPDSVQQMMSEFQNLRSQLNQLQDSALSTNPDLQARQQTVQEVIIDAMVEADSSMRAKLDSLPALQQEMMAAQQAQDTARIQSVARTGQRLQAEINVAQQQAVQQDGVAQELDGFEEQLLSAMEAIEPTVREMVSRIEELQEKLQALQPGG